jgi:CRP/FNR family cyclic AMP-dependent transcriptional regulator
MIDLWHLNNINWLRELPAQAVDTLRAAASIQVFEPGAMIFEPDRKPDYVFLLETGLVRIFRTSPRGQEITFGYVRPGEVFGELAVFSDKPRESYAAAVERSTVVRVGRDVFSDVIQTRPSIVFSVATQIGDRFKHIESRVEDLMFRSARSRLARILLHLADEFGCQEDEHSVIELRLTHAELATLAGTSRPTITIALAEFEEEGLIRRRAGKVDILSRKALNKEAAISG